MRFPVTTWLLAVWTFVPSGDAQRNKTTDRGCQEDADREFVVATKQPLGRVSFEVREKESGTLIPARLLFLSANQPSALPTVGRFRNVWITASGRETKLIPAGHYDVYISRGTEYTLDQQRVTVGEGQTIRLKSSLARVVDTTDFISSDFHFHPWYALCDGLIAGAAEGLDLVTLALNAGAKIPASYDLPAEDLAGRHALQETSRLKLDSFISSMVGLEFGSPFGHINTFPVVTTRPWRDDRFQDVLQKAVATPEQMLRFLREDEGDQIVQINHPRYGGRRGYFQTRVDPGSSRITTPCLDMNFDQIEVFNGYVDRQAEWIGRTPKVNQNLKDWFSMLNRGVLITGVGTSDAVTDRKVDHETAYSRQAQRYYPTQIVGLPRTYVASNATHPRGIDPKQVVDALRRRAATVSCGPFIRFTADREWQVGSTLSSKGREVTLQIRVDAAPWVPVDRIELIANGRVLQQFDVASATQVSRLTQELRVRPERDTWYLVLATSDRRWGPAFSRYSSFSFTNPIFVDVDGNGYFDAPEPPALAP